MCDAAESLYPSFHYTQGAYLLLRGAYFWEGAYYPGYKVFQLKSTLFQISVNTTRQRRLVQHLGETLLLQ